MKKEIKKLALGFRDFFSTYQLRDKMNTPDGDMVRRKIINANFTRMSILCVIIPLFQVVYIILDFLKGAYSFEEWQMYFNASAEALLLTSGIVFLIIATACQKRLRKNAEAMHTMYFIYYLILTVGLSLFIISDFLNGLPSTTMFFASIIFMYLPIFTPAEHAFYYSIFSVSIITSIIVSFFNPELNGNTTLGSNMQLILIFVASALIAAQVRVSTLKLHFDAIEMTKLNRQLKESSERDPLTRLANRRALDLFIANDLPKRADHGSEALAIMCDVDYFKNYNDTFSHVAGDEALVKIARSVWRYIKSLDGQGFMARMGGEEFLIIYYDWSEGDDLDRVLLGILETVSNLGIESGNGATFPCVTISAGAAMFTVDENLTIDAFYKTADNELYHTKGNGRNAVSFEGNILRNKI